MVADKKTGRVQASKSCGMCADISVNTCLHCGFALPTEEGSGVVKPQTPQSRLGNDLDSLRAAAMRFRRSGAVGVVFFAYKPGGNDHVRFLAEGVGMPFPDEYISPFKKICLSVLNSTQSGGGGDATELNDMVGEVQGWLSGDGLDPDNLRGDKKWKEETQALITVESATAMKKGGGKGDINDKRKDVRRDEPIKKGRGRPKKNGTVGGVMKVDRVAKAAEMMITSPSKQDKKVSSSPKKQTLAANAADVSKAISDKKGIGRPRKSVSVAKTAGELQAETADQRRTQSPAKPIGVNTCGAVALAQTGSVSTPKRVVGKHSKSVQPITDSNTGKKRGDDSGGISGTQGPKNAKSCDQPEKPQPAAVGASVSSPAKKSLGRPPKVTGSVAESPSKARSPVTLSVASINTPSSEERRADQPKSDGRKRKGRPLNVRGAEKRKARESSSSTPKKMKVATEETYEVEKVVGQKKNQGKLLYEVKWVGWRETTWEPAANLKGNIMLETYLNQMKEAGTV